MNSGVAEPLSDRQPAREGLAAETSDPRAPSAGRLLAGTTEHGRAEQRLVVQHVVARILAESPDLSEAVLQILQVICESLGWATSALWRVDREADVLRCVEMWHLPSVEVPEFEAVTRQRTFARGIGMPGRVWASCAPAWILDVVIDSNFPRAPIAAKEGLHAALGLPIRLGSEVLGVLEFFSPEIRSPDEELLQMMATIGSQIGQFIERKRVEEERAQLLVREQAARAEAEAAQRRLAFLAEASVILTASLDYETTLASVAKLAVPFLADWCSVDMVEADGSLRRLPVAHADPSKADMAHALQNYPPDPHGEHPRTEVLRTGRSEIASELSDARLRASARDAEHLQLVRELGYKSSMTVALVARGRTLGVITFVMAESGRRYNPADLALAEDLARRCAAAVDNARLYREAQEANRSKDESLALLDTLLASAPVGMAFLDRDLRNVRVNEALAAINGVPREAHLGRTPQEIHGGLMPGLEPLRRRVLESGEPIVNLEVNGRTRAANGRRRSWLVNYYPVRAQDGQTLGLGIVVAEITERKRAEEERERLIQQLQAEQARLETVLRQMPAGVIIAEADSGRLILANEQVEAILGTPFQLAGSVEEYGQYEGFHPDGRPYCAEEFPLARSIRTGEVVTDEEINAFRSDGTLSTLLVSSAPIRDREGRIIAGVVTLSDITERKRTEEQLKASLREKEVLLKEIHHRVRNNLQIVSSLLNLQATYSKDPQTLALFKDSQHRVKSMALVHEHLYQSTDLTKIDMAAYIQNLVMHLVGSYRLHSELVRLTIEVEELFLGIDTAIPCGLILTELVSNCLKHAFPVSQMGEIRIELRQNPNGTFLLRVSDSGVGLPPSLDFRNTESLGLQLVCSLTDQLDGTMELERSGGTAFTISFEELTYKPRN